MAFFTIYYSSLFIVCCWYTNTLIYFKYLNGRLKPHYCSHCCKPLVRSTTQECASEQNHEDGLASLITDEKSYYHLNGCNSPLAIITWGVLGFFKTVGVGLRAVWRTDILYIVKWLFQLVLIFSSRNYQENQVVMLIIVESFVLILDVVLCYTDSSISRKKMAINCSHCCKPLVRSTTQKCASEQNHEDGLASLITDEMSYYHLNGCVPF